MDEDDVRSEMVSSLIMRRRYREPNHSGRKVRKVISLMLLEVLLQTQQRGFGLYQQFVAPVNLVLCNSYLHIIKMNYIIYKGTNPKVRFQIQGLYMGQRLNKMIVNKNFNFIISYYFMKIIFVVINVLSRPIGEIS